MSGFGRPPGAITFSPTPPQRGSFPLDHEGECKPVMLDYLACLKRLRGSNDPECRMLAKDYLRCRMDRQLMAKDKWANLGFHEQEKGLEQAREKGSVAAGDKLEELKRENERLVAERKKREAEGR